MIYRELLRLPEWQKKRLIIMQRDQWKCTQCGAGDLQLHVHHKRYIQGKKPWEYSNCDLITVCYSCHDDLHKCEEFLGVCIPWSLYENEDGGIIDPFEMLLLEKIEERDSEEKPTIYHCRTQDGKSVMCDSSGAAIQISVGKIADDWIEWAHAFRHQIESDIIKHQPIELLAA